MRPIQQLVQQLSWDEYTANAGVAAAAGTITHLGWFIHGEHHKYGYNIVKFYLFLTAAVGPLVFFLGNYDLLNTAVNAVLIPLSYFAGLYASMGLYRAFFHPLRKFQGPFMCRLSNIYHSSLLKNSDNYLIMAKMHEQYGPVVRTGPGNLSVNIPEAVQIVLGSESKCTKTPWYEQSLPLVNLHTIRDKKAHERRRKVFSKAFSPQAMRAYEPRVVALSELLVTQLGKIDGQTLDATRWFKYWAFDVMGELGFGESFHMLEEDTNRWVPALLENGMAKVGKLTPIPWATPIIHRIPFLSGGPRQFLEFVGGKVKERAAKVTDKPDVLTALLEDYDKTQKREEDYQLLRGDTRLTIVGGSDTTAATLTYVFYHLAKNPQVLGKLRAELEPLLRGKRTMDPKDIASAKYLNGVMYEAMRLHPAIPSGYPRLTPPEGITIAGTYIPGNTTIVVPIWAMARSEDVYVHATEFLPERWYTPELIRHRDAFASFSLGPYSCIGKGLALMELRVVIGQLVMAFDTIKFAPGEDGSDLMTKTKDHFTVGVAPLRLTFSSGKKG